MYNLIESLCASTRELGFLRIQKAHINMTLDSRVRCKLRNMAMHTHKLHHMPFKSSQRITLNILNFRNYELSVSIRVKMGQ